MTEQTTTIDTPIGLLHVTTDEEGALVRIDFGDFADRYSLFADRNVAMQPANNEQRTANNERALTELHEYFSGRRKDFSVPTRPRGTPFQLAVWRELEKIPYGTTITYSELAERIGRPAAVRAVGAANGANPIPVVIPCHRVIGKSGKLVGYGGGLDRKTALLQIEGCA
jgi:O-6-methylguanine DNA methyltransferase